MARREVGRQNSPCGHIISPPGMDIYDKSNINELELWPIVEGLRCWYPEFKGKSVTIFTDNTQVMYILRKGTSTNSTCMGWLREIFLITKIFNIRIVAKYVNTKSNLVADTLSRLLYIKSENEARKCLEGSGSVNFAEKDLSKRAKVLTLSIPWRSPIFQF